MPLWTRASVMLLSVCGCALMSEGSPWVAQRVWPMPLLPETGECSSRSLRFSMRPFDLRREICPPSQTASPAESYPRYARAVSPSIKTGTQFFSPVYPTIPHIVDFPPLPKMKRPIISCQPPTHYRTKILCHYTKCFVASSRGFTEVHKGRPQDMWPPGVEHSLFCVCMGRFVLLIACGAAIRVVFLAQCTVLMRRNIGL